MQTISDIGIVGGGPVGQLLAVALARQDFDIVLIDRRQAAPVSESGRSFALSVASCRLLKALGFGDVLERHGQPITGVVVSEASQPGGPGSNTLSFDPGEIGELTFGCLLSEHHLQNAVSQRLAETEQVTIRHGLTAVASRIETGGRFVSSSDGSDLRTAMLAVCDGQSGFLNDLGITCFSKDYHQSAVVCTVTHTHDHDGLMRQIFLPTGPLALLPLPENQTAIVLTTEPDRAAALVRHHPDGFIATLQPMVDDALGTIASVRHRAQWPLSLSIANSLAGPRLALLGDAARRIHPLAGQGLNLGLRDVATLEDILVQARRRGEDFGMITERYQKLRRADGVAYSVATDMFNTIYSTTSPSLGALRTLGVSILANLSPARRRLLREAAGLAGECPQLMR
ncbi:MAG: FAD-dependent monooxygenase [Rhodobacteraceae bacterium]|nr:FAD-dependent monooxygenase [Paracoccaceae bacterium]